MLQKYDKVRASAEVSCGLKYQISHVLQNYVWSETDSHTQQLFCIYSEKVANDQIAQPGMCVMLSAIPSGVPYGLVCVCAIPYSPLVGDW